MPDKWHDPAKATISEFFMEPLSPVTGCMNHQACNYEERAGIDSGQCNIPAIAPGQEGVICPPFTRQQCGQRGGNATPLQKNQQNGYMVQQQGAPPMQLQKAHNGGIHAVMNIPADYTLQFDLTPGPSMVPGWSSIVHISATGNDCCAYGDRVPGIWFHPGNQMLHIRDGHADEGNAGCDPATVLRPGTTYQIKVMMARTGVTITINNQPEPSCTQARTSRSLWTSAHLFAADPWYDPADAKISNMVFTDLSMGYG